MGIKIDMDKINCAIDDSTKAIKNAAKKTGRAVKKKYSETKIISELDDLYVKLGVLVNKAYNLPGTVDEESVAALNEKINEKRGQLASLRTSCAGDETVK